MSTRLDYHDPFHEFAGRLTEALEDHHLVVSGYAFLVDVDHMSREYRYVVHLDGEPSPDAPRTFAWPWAELRFLVDALSFGRHIAEYDEGVEFSRTVHEEVQVFGELITEIMMDRLLVPPDVVGCAAPSSRSPRTRACRASASSSTSRARTRRPSTARVSSRASCSRKMNSSMATGRARSPRSFQGS